MRLSISAKELAAELGLSAAAVSMALNDKPGVSETTRQRVLEAAKACGYDFSKIKHRASIRGKIVFIIYKKHGAVVCETSFFSELTEGISRACRDNGYGLDIHYLVESDRVEQELRDVAGSGVSGAILLGTEMYTSDFGVFRNFGIPLVVLDTYFEGIAQNYVLINNVQGAYTATNYLISKRHCQPGYLRSSYPIGNFRERADGFYKAIRENGYSPSKSIVHQLAPSIDGAYSDMLEILKRREPIAACYFADNDLIAAGAMKALKESGYKIPEDVGIIGFDNTTLCELLEPPLTTVNVPRQALARVAVERLISVISSGREITKTEVMTTLIQRRSL